MSDPSAARIRRLTLTNFRSYRAAGLAVDGGAVVLIGANGAGKTNLLEAISFLAPGRGLRRATLEEVAFNEGDGAWAVSAEVEGALGLATLGTGIEPPTARTPRRARKCRIDREPVASAAAFADHLRVVWLMPAMDGLFLGAGRRTAALPRPAGARGRCRPRRARQRAGTRAALAQPAAGRSRGPIRTGSTPSSTRPPSWPSPSRPARAETVRRLQGALAARRATRFRLPVRRDRPRGLDREPRARPSRRRDRGSLSRRAARTTARATRAPAARSTGRICPTCTSSTRRRGSPPATPRPASRRRC